MPILTLDVPTEVVDDYALHYGWTVALGITKGVYAKQRLIASIREAVLARRRSEQQEIAEQNAQAAVVGIVIT